ncbi:MAG: anion permease [Chloroflexi bacterium]|nr:anion permease [Chloroflexota bacterium]
MATVAHHRPHLSLPHFPWHGVKLVPLLITLAVGAILWMIPPPQVAADALPQGANIAKAWHLLAIFVATIVGIITKPLPMGAVAILGVTATALTNTLTIADALSGFQDTTIWLIVLAFFIARGFIKTGLGSRIAYQFVRMLGTRTLGLGYGLIATDLVLAPAIPSNTARAGGVVFPILKSLSTAYGSRAEDGTARKMGAYLTITAFQGTIITSAMFLTAMAANPLAAKLAADMGIAISWTNWAVAALVPGLASLIIVPALLYKLYAPEIKSTPAAAEMARTELAKMGPMSADEWMMLGTFGLLLVLWIFGPQLGNLNATTAALVGLGVLLLVGVLSWKDVQEETGAWDTLVWFAALVMMAGFLNKLGLVPWFSKAVGDSLAGVNWVYAFLALSLVYLYSHYMFASNTAHVGAMYAAFLGVSVAVGTPPVLAALVLAFFSNLMSSMTHYGTGPAPVLFGAGYVDIGTWWKLGFVVSVVNVVIWLVLGGLWWKVLGLW